MWALPAPGAAAPRGKEIPVISHKFRHFVLQRAANLPVFCRLGLESKLLHLLRVLLSCGCRWLKLRHEFGI
jgi:hypothetical protein